MLKVDMLYFATTDVLLYDDAQFLESANDQQDSKQYCSVRSHRWTCFRPVRF